MAESEDQTIQPEAAADPVVSDDVQVADDLPKVEPAAPPPAKRRGGIVVPLIGGALAAAMGFGLAQVVPQGWPLQDIAPLQQGFASQTDQLAGLEARLTTVEGAKLPDISPLMETLAALNARVVALENGPAERAEESAAQNAALSETIAKLQADLAALAAAGPAAPASAGESAAAIALAAEAEARLKEAETQAAAMKAEAEALTRAAVAQAAFGRLQAAIDSGTPYAAILPDLGLELPAALAAHASTGLPSLADLQETFPEAARLALEASLRADMGDSWTERATSFFRSQTGARSLTPREGNDPDAILSRAEAALTSGDLAGALDELAALPQAAQGPLADWQAKAATRQAGLKALAYVAGKIGG